MRRAECLGHLLSITAFLLGALGIDRGLGALFSSALPRIINDDAMKHVNLAPAFTDGGIVVFGNSRAAYHIDSRALSEQTGLNSYNAGTSGKGAHFQRALEELLLQEPVSAKLFVLQVDPEELTNPFPIDGVQVLMPFLGRSKQARNLLLQCDKRAWIKQASMTWRFNSMIHDFSGIGPGERSGIQFRPLVGEMDPRQVVDAAQKLTAASAKRQSPTDTEVMMEMYRDFIRRARDNQIEVALLVGPRLLRRIDWKEDGLVRFRQLAAEANVPLLQLDEEHYPEFRDPAVYFDRDHLNGRGAALLTGLLSRHIREIMSAREQPSPRLIQAGREQDPVR